MSVRVTVQFTFLYKIACVFNWIKIKIVIFFILFVNKNCIVLKHKIANFEQWNIYIYDVSIFFGALVASLTGAFPQYNEMLLWPGHLNRQLIEVIEGAVYY